MRLTAFFKLYKICILLHRCNLEIFNKKSVLKISNYYKNSANILQVLQNVQNVAKIQHFQLNNLVHFENYCKTRIYLQRSVPIQPKTSEMLPKFAKIGNYPTGPHRGVAPGLGLPQLRDLRHRRARELRHLVKILVLLNTRILPKISNFCKI